MTLRSLALLLVIAASACGEPKPTAEPPAFATLDVGSAKATRALEVEAEDRPQRPSEVKWGSDPDAGLADAIHRKRALVLVFAADWSAASHEVDAAFADRAIRARLAERFVAVRVDMTDDDAPNVAARAKAFAVKGLPTIVVFDRTGHEVARAEQYLNVRDLERLLDKAP